MALVVYVFATVLMLAAGLEATLVTTGQPDNVVVIQTDVKEIPGTADAAGAPSVDYRSTGSGPVVILRDVEGASPSDVSVTSSHSPCDMDGFIASTANITGTLSTTAEMSPTRTFAAVGPRAR